MNRSRREMLLQASELLGQAYGIIYMALDQEQDCFDNMPENLQDSDRCRKMESVIENLESAIESIDEANCSLELART